MNRSRPCLRPPPLTAIGGLLVALLLPAAAQAARIVEESSLTAPWGIARNQWGERVTAGGGAMIFATFGYSGSFFFGSDLRDVAVASDGTFWILEPNADKVWHFVSNTHEITGHTVPGGPSAIASGPDGNMWITESTGNKIARVTPKGVVSEFPIPTPNSHPSAITLAGDGNLWFTEGNGNKIGSVTPAGVVADYPLTSAGASPSAIAAKGALLAFSEPGVNKIGYAYVDEPGSIFEDPVPTPGSSPQAITLGADGAFWFVEYLGNRVARAVFGAIVEYPIPTSASHPRSITATNDGELLFTEQSGGKSGRVQLHPLGDVNGDGSVGVGDVFYLIDFLFAGGPEPK